MNITPSHSGTAGAHAASHAHSGANAQSTNSSLADFLLGQSADDPQDFKSIAASLFGVKSSTANPAQPPTKESAAGKKPVTGLSQEGSETRRSKDGSDPALSVPLLNVPQPLIQVTPHPETPVTSDVNATTNMPGLLDIKSVPDNSILAGKSQIADKKADLAEQRSALQDAQALAAAGKESPDPGGNAPLTNRPAIADSAMQGKEAALRMSPVSASPVNARKPATDPSRETLDTDSRAGKQTSAQATSNSEPSPAPDAALIVNSAPVMPPAVPSTSPLEQASATSAKAILDSAMSANATQPSVTTNPALATDSGTAAVQTAPLGSTTIGDVGITDRAITDRALTDHEIKTFGTKNLETKARAMKDRDLKDSKAASTPTGKLGGAEAGNIADAVTRPASTTLKEVSGVAMSAHSDAHAKPETLKQSVGAPLAQGLAVDGDGPDEAVPTSLPSPINAKFVQSLSGSEFRVGMQTQEFGNIDIRTSVARHLFSAQISVEHGDFAKSMTADLPALYHRLADQQVPVASIVIQGQSLATSSGLAQDAQPQKWQSQSNSVTKSSAEPMLPVMAETLESSGRLDIRI